MKKERGKHSKASLSCISWSSNLVFISQKFHCHSNFILDSVSLQSFEGYTDVSKQIKHIAFFNCENANYRTIIIVFDIMTWLLA